MIPSLVNLVIGGASLVRGLPGLATLLLRKIPVQANVPKFDRAWIATVLTAQVAAGAALGVAAQAFLVVVIIGYVMPFFGLELLQMARDVAAFNLPARVGQLFGVGLQRAARSVDRGFPGARPAGADQTRARAPRYEPLRALCFR